MKNLLDVPVASIIALTADRAVEVVRAILRSECHYAKLGPQALTISSRLNIADGGIDAEISNISRLKIPSDCIFQEELTGFQIKSGTAFKPWTSNAIRRELLDRNGKLHSQVERLARRRACYTLICTGHDLTPEQRNEAQRHVSATLEAAGFGKLERLIQVYGASQIAEFAERYPGVASLVAIDLIQEAWVLDEWRRDAHMTNAFEVSLEQSEVIDKIRAELKGETKHVRVLGEPGLGKTRIVLEAVKDIDIAPYVLYVQHGSQFGRTRLFRQLLRSIYNKPMVLVVDELPESEMSDIWRHLKSRCGTLKLVSLDHGGDETYDSDIVRINVPRLTDETIHKILTNRVGESREYSRWVAMCEGSPRVAHAVAENLVANPDDLLKPPTTVPIWERFLHGYGSRDSASERQVDCVAQHLALFSRFGYEDPVGSEARYIHELTRKLDPTIGWAQFQEIVQSLRARRVLQGSRTLFFVPRALHIHLWKRFWENYGRGFEFAQTFSSVPASLRSWFLGMFRYADNAATNPVIDEILRPDGIFSHREMLTSVQGTRFLSTLAEANPQAVLRLLEKSFSSWTNQEIFDFKDGRQHLVWALEKIAVWPAYTLRAIKLLTRFSVNESANFSNNATGTLLGLFRIGPEFSATESTPKERLPGVLHLLRAQTDAERRLGLEAVGTALEHRGGFRIIGPEFQGLRERAKLWAPKTYGEWWQAKYSYFQALIDETRDWPPHLRRDVCQAQLKSVQEVIVLQPCSELAFQVLGELIEDEAMPAKDLNEFFWHWREYRDDNSYSDVSKRLRKMERLYTRRSFESKFRRYVVNVPWAEWLEMSRSALGKSRNRSKVLVDAMARRVARQPEKLLEIRHLLSLVEDAPALWHFGVQLAINDLKREFLPVLQEVALESRHFVCLNAYLWKLHLDDRRLYLVTVEAILSRQSTAWLGAEIALRLEYEEILFLRCLKALELQWIEVGMFSVLKNGKSLESVPLKNIWLLLRQLHEIDTQESLQLVVELLDFLPVDSTSPFSESFVFEVLSKTVPEEQSQGVARAYRWKSVCQKLVMWNPAFRMPLLDLLFVAFGDSKRFSSDLCLRQLANDLFKDDPGSAWNLVKSHLEESLPRWRSDLLDWLKGGVAEFAESGTRGAIAEVPVARIIDWIEEDPMSRAAPIAHAAPRTLDSDSGGQLTRELIVRYGEIDGVMNGISATFHSGSWTGLASNYLKRKRDRFRKWLAEGFEPEVSHWVEAEIEYLDREIQREEVLEERSRFD